MTDKERETEESENSDLCEDSENQPTEVILDTIQDFLKELDLQVDRIEEKQTKLDNDICDQDGVLDSQKNIKVDTGENSSQIAINEKKMSDLANEVEFLKGLVLNQNLQIDNLRRENRSMRNVLFHNVAESPSQKGSTKKFGGMIVSVLRSTQFDNPQNLVFERVHHIGPYNSTAKSPRPIVAKLLSYKDTERALQHNKSLVKGEGKPFITL